MTTIVMCGDQGRPEPPPLVGADVVTVPDLCWRLGRLADLVPHDETSLLLALHGKDSVPGRVQAAVRRLGFDPLGVGVLDLDGIGDRRSLVVALAALVARMDAYPGSRPQQVKLARRPARTTRRSLLALGAPAYEGAPMIDGSSCVASDGCRACVLGCPADALTWGGGTVTYDKSACIACGVCVTTCPTGAVVNPVVTPRAIEAEVRTAIEISSEPLGIRYVCATARRVPMPGWHQVVVPCTGMVTVGWLLAPLVLGASSVDAATCDEGGCGRDRSRRTVATLDDAAAVLAALGVERGPLDGPAARSGLFDPGSTQRVLAALHGAVPAATHLGFVELGQADVGSIAIDESACTACAMCAEVCPTDALRAVHRPGALRIDFDPCGCVACGQCVAACPEIDRGAINLVRGFDPDDWSRGRRQVRQDSTAACERCGRPVAPASMLARISSILGDDHSGTLELIGARCIDCRGR